MDGAAGAWLTGVLLTVADLSCAGLDGAALKGTRLVGCNQSPVQAVAKAAGAVISGEWARLDMNNACGRT